MKPFVLFLAAFALAGSLLAADATAPDFTLQDAKGRNVTLSAYRGKVVWVAFWATWCAACKEELKALNLLREEFGPQGFEVLAVNTDGPDQKTRALHDAKLLKLNGPLLFDPDGRVLQRFLTNGLLPFSVLVDKSGRVRGTYRGYEPGRLDEMKSLVKTLLSEPG